MKHHFSSMRQWRLYAVVVISSVSALTTSLLFSQASKPAGKQPNAPIKTKATRSKSSPSITTPAGSSPRSISNDKQKAAGTSTPKATGQLKSVETSVGEKSVSANSNYKFELLAVSGSPFGPRDEIVQRVFDSDINDQGDVAALVFFAPDWKTKGVYAIVSPRGTIHTGDTLDGAVLTSLGRPRLNDKGSLAFAASFNLPSGTCPRCLYQGVFLNDKLVVHSGDKLDDGEVLYSLQSASDRIGAGVDLDEQDNILFTGRQAFGQAMAIRNRRVIQKGIQTAGMSSRGAVTFIRSKSFTEGNWNFEVCRSPDECVSERAPYLPQRVIVADDGTPYMSREIGMSSIFSPLDVSGNRITVDGTAGFRVSYGQSENVSSDEFEHLHSFLQPAFSTRILSAAVNRKGQIALVVEFGKARPGRYVQFETTQTWALMLATPKNLKEPEPAEPSLVDPVTIPTAGANAKVLSMPQDLAGKEAREIVGVAADGVARVVLRIPVNGVGSEVKVEVCGEKKEDTTSCGNQNLNEYGGLAELDDLRGNSATVTVDKLRKAVTVKGTNAGVGPMAFVVYRAPLDFTRKLNGSPGGGAQSQSPGCPSSYVLADCQAASRSLFLKISYPGAAFAPKWREVKVVRPPLVFVHGFNAGASDWDTFILRFNYGGVMPRQSAEASPRREIFRIFTADYGQYVSEGSGPEVFHVRSEPPYSDPPSAGHILDDLRYSHLGFTVTSPCILQQISSVLSLAPGADTIPPYCSTLTAFAEPDSFRLGNNPITAKIAAAQVDVVAHSMGGLVARYLVASVAAQTASPYGSLLVHKLVTLGTPHLGTPYATLQLLPDAECSRDQGASKAGTYALTTVYMKTGSVPGAAGEMSGDGFSGLIMSSALADLDRVSPIGLLPTALVAGRMSDASITLASLVRLACSSNTIGPRALPVDPVAERFTREAYGSIFDPHMLPASGGSSAYTPNDGIVPVFSALAGRTGAETRVFENRLHSSGIDLLAGGLFGTASDHLQDGDDSVVNHVKSLLNRSVVDASFARR